MYTTLISSADLAAHLGDPNWQIIDCRFQLMDTEAGRRAYREAHLPGAWYAHLDEDLSGAIIPGETGRHPLPPVEQLAATFSQWGIERMRSQVVVYDDMGGAIAARLWWLLRWLGHEWVAVLDGGWSHWQKEGRPISSEEPSLPAPAPFEPQLRSEVYVEADFVEQVSQNPAYTLIDARAPERYRGEVEPIDPVAGHIPGAVNAPHSGNLDAEGLFLSQEALRERFRSILGEADARHTISYCGSGVTACHNLLAMMHAGLGEAKLYPGSWSEWVADPNREIA